MAICWRAPEPGFKIKGQDDLRAQTPLKRAKTQTIRRKAMPLVRIDLRKGKQDAYRAAVSRIVHEALVSVGVPKDEQKKALYKAIADGLATNLSLRQEDVFIGLVEVKRENWSFGNGIAQYA
jgi:phenylpyruvate tautomerase PptA (4-oxalocrotonate tautomerase family)